jgi:hypothetical protein
MVASGAPAARRSEGTAMPIFGAVLLLLLYRKWSDA